MKIKNLFLYVLFLTTLNGIQTKAEDLSDEYKSQKDCSWEKAAYVFVNYKGEANRFCIDNKSNIYQIIEKGRRGAFSGINLSALGPIRLGNLKKPEVTTGNSCVLGTNVQCLSNVVNTITQYKVEGNYLKKYTRRDMNGNKGNVNSSVLGIHRNGISELLEKVVSLNKLSVKAYSEGKFDQAAKYAWYGRKWLDNQVGRYMIALSQYSDGENIEYALNNMNSLINKKSSLEYGGDEKKTSTDEARIYSLRASIKYKLQMDKNNYCKDIEKAVQLSPDDEQIKTNYNNFKCN